MPVAVAVFSLSILMPLSGLAAGPAPSGHAPGASSASTCPRTTSYLAANTDAYRGQPLLPRKLTELPPATAYMAVYRHVGPCEDPLTMASYRRTRQQ